MGQQNFTEAIIGIQEKVEEIQYGHRRTKYLPDFSKLHRISGKKGNDIRRRRKSGLA